MRLFQILAVAACCSFGGIAPAFSQAKIKISYSFTYDRIRPEPQQNVPITNSLDIDLSQSGSVKEDNTRASGRFSDNKKIGAKLGGAWEVVSADQLRRTFDHPQSQIVMTVSVTGNTCKLDVKFSLKPGFQEYKFKRITDGTWAYFTEPKIQSTHCTIQ